LRELFEIPLTRHPRESGDLLTLRPDRDSRFRGNDDKGKGAVLKSSRQAGEVTQSPVPIML